jgi:hypothetical protein
MLRGETMMRRGLLVVARRRQMMFRAAQMFGHIAPLQRMSLAIG